MDKKVNASSKDSIISSFNTLSSDEKIDLIGSLVSSLKKAPSNFIPIAIFDNTKLSVFEALVKYMKEILNLRFVKIADLLERSDKTIWATYNSTKKKMPMAFSSLSSDINIPLEKFSNNNLTIFESLVYYLKSQEFSNHEIGVTLHRDDRTIWSVYDRAKKKISK